jgi:soluble lytic murein transglycosylase-like protein
MRYTLLASAILILAASSLAAQPPAPHKKPFYQEKKVTDFEKELDSLKREVAFLRMAPLPERLTLCDRTIPLANTDVRESFEREFYQFLENRGLLTILVKRYGKFLKVVSEEIDRAAMPPDLIYLALAESYLNPRAVSKANAGGLWQFIKDTGKKEGLFISDSIDERYSVTRSTKSALGYLNKLHNEFGDWLVAMAAYNAGEVRVREAIQNQNTRDFFEMFLPEETERYVYRIAALKEILANPAKYGLPIEKGDYYKPYAVVEVTIDVEKETHTALLAAAMDLPYKTFRQYNLHIRKYRLPRGVYRLYIPVEKKETFLKRLGTCPGVTLGKDSP